MATSSLASPSALTARSPLWVNPSEIRFKISPHHDLTGTKGGNWDIDRRFHVEQSAKYRSIIERYTQGKPWEETDLFTDLYRRRFEQGDSIRCESTMKALLVQYYSQVDGLFEDMKRNGFKSKQSRLPRLLIGRGGEVFIGNQGNHRLAMAVVLNIEIEGEVICRHRLLDCQLSRP